MLVRPLSRTDEVIGDERVPRVRFNMLVRPLSRTNEVVGDECVPRIPSLQSFLMDDPYGRSKTCAFSIHHQLSCPSFPQMKQTIGSLSYLNVSHKRSPSELAI